MPDTQLGHLQKCLTLVNEATQGWKIPHFFHFFFLTLPLPTTAAEKVT